MELLGAVKAVYDKTNETKTKQVEREGKTIDCTMESRMHTLTEKVWDGSGADKQTGIRAEVKHCNSADEAADKAAEAVITKLHENRG